MVQNHFVVIMKSLIAVAVYTIQSVCWCCRFTGPALHNCLPSLFNHTLKSFYFKFSKAKWKDVL